MNETLTMSMDKLIDRLADLYRTDRLVVAKCCDEVLDRSGALLGYVRERHIKSMSLQIQTITAACNGEVCY